ncbi:magnesium and cobalt transport protein CorA [Hanstruepera neustonica]|uniref:Magnesium transport protein CorA n=1 Tax=Hanstruepera neustonica TaxID=1445657 RepID=A0A2K1DXS1_9FLAO|nr:magnesium/cobalt transporter CorA [Hanstruepera neustonica]PNQ72824.1 magnesium and cobalt transport protein CorA [Hanstruepera neustonica]
MGKKRTTKYKKHIGQVPGAIIYTGEKTAQKLFIESFDYTETTINEQELTNIEDVFSYKSTESTTWININGLNYIDEIEKIGNHYDLHPLILEDIVNTSQRPKIDEYEDYIFIILKMLYYDKDENIVSEQVSLVLGDNYVLTFQESEGDVFDTVRDRLRQAKGRIRNLGSDYLLYALIDAVVDHYYIVNETMGNKVEDLEDMLFEGVIKENLNKQVLDLKKELLKVRRVIFPLREIISRVEKSDHKLIKKKTIQFYRDIYDHIIQLSDTIDIYREMIFSLMDMYMTSISNKMNEVMKVLTIMATIFIPLTFIAGIYGMNFDHMPELHYQYSYYILWAVMIAVFLGMLYYFKRKKWL